MLNQLEELENTFIEEYESCIILEEYSKNKSITILLSKALFALTDFIIFKKYKKLPKNHSERFRILKEKFPSTYLIVDSLGGEYTDSYSKPALLDSISLLKNGIKKVALNETISEKIKEVLKK